MHKIQLNTKVEIPTTDQVMQRDTPHLFLGSCFAENIGKYLLKLKGNTLVNPFGIIYNPVSLARMMEKIGEGTPYREEDLYQRGELWLSLDHHGTFSSPSKEQTLNSINRALKEAQEHLKACRTIFITLGTAWVYRFLEKDRIVANCHKIPARAFQKELLTPSLIEEALGQLTSHARELAPASTFVFSVSPVRHVKDGLVENNRSKAHLLTALHNFCEKEGHYYFPAYEMLLDELRDYRFYADDLVHPSTKAISIIRERFLQTFFDERARSFFNEMEKLNRTLSHRPFYPKSKESKVLRENLIGKIKEAEKKYPDLDFNREVKKLREMFEA